MLFMRQWLGLRENNVKTWADLPPKVAIEALANRVDRFSRTVPCLNKLLNY
jgi:hypothetical protein